MINCFWEDLTFGVQEGTAGEWARAIDTGSDSPGAIVEPSAQTPLASPEVRKRA